MDDCYLGGRNFEDIFRKFHANIKNHIIEQIWLTSQNVQDFQIYITSLILSRFQKYGYVWLYIESGESFTTIKILYDVYFKIYAY